MKIIPVFCPNYFTPEQMSESKILGICLHGTAGSLASALAELTNPKPLTPKLAVSANFLVARNGYIYQLVEPFSGRRAWANGNLFNPDRSVKWIADCQDRKINPNWHSVSIEHEATWADMERHNYAAITDEQWAASQALSAYILQRAGLKANHETITTHGQYDSVNKTNCPGVLFGPSYAEQLGKSWPALKG